MKDSNSIFQITLLKAIIVIYFLNIILNSLGSSVSFFYDNAEFGIWAFISFLMISGFILFVDIAIVSLVCKIFKNKNKRGYILIFQLIFCAVVYFGLNYMFENADKWNENAINGNQKTVDTLQTVSAEKQLQDIYIKDKSQYDQKFIDGLADFKEQIKLVDNFIIVGKDTAYFPEDLILNKKTTFTALKDNHKFSMTVTRTNLTNINYKFQLIDKDNAVIDSKTGQAILGSGFFLAPEGEPDLETGISFVSNEYGMQNESFWIVIKIGMDKDYEGKKRAKIIYGHIDKSKMTEPVMESPILRIE
ncbi:MAG: hypothetical protein ACK5XN_35185 [Bacteroidota bacterium]